MSEISPAVWVPRHATPEGVEYRKKYNAIGCCATRALGNAGWDSNQIKILFSLDFHKNPIQIQWNSMKIQFKLNGIGNQIQIHW